MLRGAKHPELPLHVQVLLARERVQHVEAAYRKRMAEIAVIATVYLMDRGHRPTGETMGQHFAETCRCVATGDESANGRSETE